MAILRSRDNKKNESERLNREKSYFCFNEKTILVTGSKGQLGISLNKHCFASNGRFKVIYANRSTLDIANFVATDKFIKENSIDYIINCAAYTAVDKAEEERELCYLINHKAVENLAKISVKKGCKLIHISSDYVFDGDSNKPYNEESLTHPLSVYGESKLKGEEAIKEFAPESIIIRTGWLYSPYKHNFVKTMLRLMDERAELGIVADQYGTPTYAIDLAQAIEDIICYSEEKEFIQGVYNYSNEGVCSWFDFAKKIKEYINNEECTINAITTDQYPTPAKRPKWSVLDKDKIASTFDMWIPYWEDSLLKCIKEIKNNDE